MVKYIFSVFRSCLVGAPNLSLLQRQRLLQNYSDSKKIYQALYAIYRCQWLQIVITYVLLGLGIMIR